MPARKIHINQKYGELLVLEQISSNSGQYKYKVQCDCGNVVNIFISNNIHRNQLHCGCKTKKHGLSNTKIYKIWMRLKNRNKLCDEWKDINQFIKDVGTEDKGFIKPIKNGLISPSNFMWTTNRNSGRGNLIAINNISHNVNEWSKICGVSRQALQQKKEYYKSSYEQIILTYPKALYYIQNFINTQNFHISR